MTDTNAKFKSIIEKVLTLANSYSAPPNRHHFTLPRLIATGDGRSIEISKEIDDLISDIAVDLKSEVSSRVTAHTDEEWREAVRRAFGLGLSAVDINLNADQQANRVTATVREYLQKLDEAVTPYEYSFGLSFLQGNEIRDFEIGPVRFEPRSSWLVRKHSEGAVTAITKRRILKAWQGVRITKRSQSTDSVREHNILDAVGKCSWVVSVSTIGLANDAGKQRALTTARMATAVVALFWAKPSVVLDGVNLIVDRSVRHERVLTFIPGRIILSGARMIGRPNGPVITKADWEQHIVEYDLVLRAASEVLSYYLEPTGDVRRPKLMSALAQAILWFHEGCRETVTLMAIVKFTASLDALATGGKSSGIKKMITARLGISLSDILWQDGMTMEEGVNQIYSEGRSRTMHGTNDKLGHDWTSLRARAEGLSRLCLIVCMEWASKNPTIGQPKALQI